MSGLGKDEITAKIKELKASKADQSLIDPLVAQLKELGKKKEVSSDDIGRKFEIKTPKGTKDFLPEEMAVREDIFSTITRIFKRHGGVTIDTPVFELRDILMGKYGEDSKLIYDLQDQGGELCSLRYDLTVPFARFLACNGHIGQIKRYHIGKVYRRDNPSVNKGRMREFYQCDFDIAGEFGPMIPDSEALKIMVDLLTAVNVGDFIVKVNHRKILDGMFEVCGVPPEKFRQISSAIDKLDKLDWADVKKEMVVEKGLDEAVADRIGEYVKLSGSSELCDVLAADERLSKNSSALAGIADMRLLFTYLEIFGVKGKMSFDVSLARGLDYYTGLIYEAVLTAKNEETSGVGSIASGGRYDDLVGMFSGKKIPCIGISIGLERIFAIIYARLQRQKTNIRLASTEVFIIGLGSGHLQERMKIAAELWDAGLCAEFTQKEKPRREAQFKAVESGSIPIIVLLDDDKFKNGMVQVENTRTKEKFIVSRKDMIGIIKAQLQN